MEFNKELIKVKMNSFLSHMVSGIAANLKEVKGIVLRGSQQTDSIVDLWSDTDLLVVLNHGSPVNDQEVIRVINEIGNVVGSEVHWYSEQSLLYKSAIEYESSIHLLDTHICSYDEWISTESLKDQLSTMVYGNLKLGEKIPSAAGNYSFESYESSNTWFKYFIAIKKFARNDNLVGLHLLLDLIKEYLVVEMIERDIRHETNIHRFGYGEQLPNTIEMSLIDTSDKIKVFDFIANLANEYDKKLVSNMNGYKSRYEQVANYLEKSKQYITH